MLIVKSVAFAIVMEIIRTMQLIICNSYVRIVIPKQIHIQTVNGNSIRSEATQGSLRGYAPSMNEA